MRRICVVVLLVIMPSVLLSQSNRYAFGVIIGSPTGLSGKFMIARKSAISIHAGWSFIGNKGLHVTGDYQFLFPGVIKLEGSSSASNLIPYLGIGGRFRLKEKEDDTNDFHLGLRLGGGIEYIISRFGIFLELYPVVDVLPETAFDFEGGIGGRFYF